MSSLVEFENCSHKTKNNLIKVADSAREVILKNVAGNCITYVKFDGCVLKQETAADFLVLIDGDVEAILELKGRNIEHALDQIEATAIWLRSHDYQTTGKTGAISCKQVPSGTSRKLTKIEERLRRRFGLRIEKSSSKRSEPPRICRRPQLVRSRVYDKQNDEQILS